MKKKHGPAVALSEATSTVDVGAPDSDSPVIAIQQLAYEMFLSRGARDGSDLADWLEAERIVMNQTKHVVWPSD